MNQSRKIAYANVGSCSESSKAEQFIGSAAFLSTQSTLGTQGTFDLLGTQGTHDPLGTQFSTGNIPVLSDPVNYQGDSTLEAMCNLQIGNNGGKQRIVKTPASMHLGTYKAVNIGPNRDDAFTDQILEREFPSMFNPRNLVPLELVPFGHNPRLEPGSQLDKFGRPVLGKSTGNTASGVVPERQRPQDHRHLFNMAQQRNMNIDGHLSYLFNSNCVSPVHYISNKSYHKKQSTNELFLSKVQICHN